MNFGYAVAPVYDAHNHLQDAWLAPHYERMFADLARVPLRCAVVNGTSETDWPDVTRFSRAHRFILPSYGLHPWNVGNATSRWKDDLQRVLDDQPHAGIGEIGLDRWILHRARPDDSRLSGLRRASIAEQEDAFVWQLELASARGLPVTIHCLDAWGALADVLRRVRLPRCGFLLHAYGGSAELVHEFVPLGAYFSFNGYFLGARQAARRDVFKVVPTERLLVETDAPAMPLPAEWRDFELPGLADGNPVNHPANIVAVYRGLAEVRGITLAELAASVAENFHRLFGPWAATDSSGRVDAPLAPSAG